MTPAHFPKPDQLKKWMQSMAALDAVLSPEWEYRFYSFDAGWSDSEQLGSVRNGSGDDLYVLFNDYGCYVKGYAHEYPTKFKPQEFYNSVPEEFAAATTEPAFTVECVSYCYWHLNSEGAWQNSIPEESLEDDVFFLIKNLDGSPLTYMQYAENYFEVEVDLEIITSIFAGRILTQRAANVLNPDIDYQSLVEDLKTIGFPCIKG